MMDVIKIKWNKNYSGNFRSFPRILLILFQLFLLMALTGCKRLHPDDPFEPYNRVMFKINKGVDMVAIKPFAYIYNTALPKPVKQIVGNFFQNFKEIPNVINDALQANRCAFFHDAARFTINTTLGIGGLFDVASCAGLKPHSNDFGLTLAHWGNCRSNYFVLPILGPSTIRDTIGFVITYYMSPWPYIASSVRVHHHKAVGLSNALFIVYMLDTRARLLELDGVIKTAAIDEYAFVRDAYLQRRAHQMSGQESPQCNGASGFGNNNMTDPTQSVVVEDLPGPPD